MDQANSSVDAPENAHDEAAPTPVEPLKDPKQAPIGNFTTPSYTLNEKYFQVEPEVRIRRYQYFVRSIVPGLLLLIILAIGAFFMLPALIFL